MADSKSKVRDQYEKFLEAFKDVAGIKATFVFDGDMYPLGLKEKDLTDIRDDLQLLSTDILVATYPKAGTTWVQEIIWSLLHGPGTADKRGKPMDEVFPFLELNALGTPGIEQIKSLPHPRLIKTHLQTKFFKRQLKGRSPCPKIIVVIRDPKDVLVSYYHFLKMGKLFDGDWHEYMKYAKEKQIPYGDVVDHILSWWKYHDHPNVHFVKYGDLKKAPGTSIQGVADILQVPITETILEAIVQETSFASMKARPTEKYFSETIPMDMSKFFRQGKVGSWKEYFTEEQRSYMDNLIATKLTSAGITF